MSFEDAKRERHLKQAELMLELADGFSEDGYISLTKPQALAVRHWLRLLREEAEIEQSQRRQHPKLIRVVEIEYEKPDGIEITFFSGDEQAQLLAEYGVSFGEPSIVGMKTARGGTVVADRVRVEA